LFENYKTQAKHIIEAEEKHDKLLNLLDPELRKSYKIRIEEAIKEGMQIDTI